MYCNKCGNQIKDDALFCDKCGAKIEKNNSENNASNVNNENVSSEQNANIITPSKNFDLLIIVAAILSIISTFLPFITISFFGTPLQKSYFDGDGKIIVIISILAIVFSVLNKKIAVIVCGIINLSILIFDTFNITSFAGQNEAANEIVKSMIIKGPGYYLLFIASIGLVAAGVYSKFKENNNGVNEALNLTNIKNKIVNLTNSVSDKAKSVDIKDGKTKKVLAVLVGIIVLVVAIIFGLSLRNPGKFVKNMYGEEQYKFRDGTFAKNKWVTHNGKEYHFDENGIIQKDKWVDEYYYVDENGVKRKNYFLEYNDDKYYLKSDGKYAKKELVDISGATYAFDDEGKLKSNTLWENATPSYTAYVNKDGTIRKTKGYYDVDNYQTIYVKDNKTGALVTSEWLKNSNTGKYNFFNEAGVMEKDVRIECFKYGDNSNYFVCRDDKKIENNTLKIILGMSSELVKDGLTVDYYYVDEDGNMLTDTSKYIDGNKWTFDSEGKATIDLWGHKNYINTNQQYLINQTKYEGIYFTDAIYDSKEAHLEIVVDKSDVTLFLYEGENRKQIKNNYSYIDEDYDITMYSKACSPSYNFTGTMDGKSDRVRVDRHQAVTTILNHLQTGMGFVIRIINDSYYSKKYVFYVDPQNFPQVYDDTFAIKNGWRGDSYYVNNIKVTNQWQEYNGDWYYLGSDGNIVKNKWVDNEYYVDKDGKMLKDTITPDGYKVDKNGKYIK
ncbi:MAG: zinc-ribbon domain-containing protein [Lachnospiraceae bacterium]|nr:zinc-ribbon domain-containing protein [Lachnospiraceae bacterium]